MPILKRDPRHLDDPAVGHLPFAARRDAVADVLFDRLRQRRGIAGAIIAAIGQHSDQRREIGALHQQRGWQFQHVEKSIVPQRDMIVAIDQHEAFIETIEDSFHDR